MEVISYTDSSCIDAVYFKHGITIVAFKSGAVYSYHGIRKETLLEWEKAPSLGRFFLERIRPHYEGVKC